MHGTCAVSLSFRGVYYQYMNVEFEEEEALTMGRPKSKKNSPITRMFIRVGVAKDEGGAQRVLLIISGVCLIAALLIVLNLFGIL